MEDSIILQGHPDENSTRPRNICDFDDLGQAGAATAQAREAPINLHSRRLPHGGMTELEEAELTDGQGRALSAHKSRAYDGYAKRTMERALAATRKRHAHRLANTAGTDVQNEPLNRVQNDFGDQYRKAK